QKIINFIDQMNFDLKKLFEYQPYGNKKGCCDVNTQLTVQSILSKNMPNFIGYCVTGPMNLSRPDVRFLMKQLFCRKFVDWKEDRAIGALMGLAIGDALGAPLEFRPLQYNTVTLNDM